MKHPPFVCHQTSSIDDFGNVVVLGSSRLGIIQGAVGGNLGVTAIGPPQRLSAFQGKRLPARAWGLWGWVGWRMIGRGGWRRNRYSEVQTIMDQKMTLKTIFKNPVFRGMIIGFICSLVAFEWVRIQVGGIKHGESTFRFLREEATIEMHAEDIWKNGKSTLKEFNPSVCKVAVQEDWLNRWYEVSCAVENEQNFPCTYVARYGAGSSYFFWWLNLFSTIPSRESCYAK